MYTPIETEMNIRGVELSVRALVEYCPLDSSTFDAYRIQLNSSGVWRRLGEFRTIEKHHEEEITDALWKAYNG